MNIEQALFGAFAFLTLFSAAVVIFAKSPIHSAMALVSTFFFLAGIYVLLWAHTLAVMQVLVYAGAIMVLFLFVIMLLNLGEEPPGPRLTLTRIIGGATALGLFAALAITLERLPSTVADLGAQAQTFGTLETIGKAIFSSWLFPFEAVSLLLLVSMVGSVVVAKSRI
ncbi:NADH-quinone oxidoreductase subunit J family protein [Stigmatella aurantiaca]|uniref:NADH-quinone oxidoreductase subunit J n=1 Tax=Stigmatella aurantiaca (strain DW4/3-1) TaxID=378806 RepID=Q092S9_STIAD|nr:NADH-quinone oxidoreductase subunit J [Stigmatella aurantiaca]ADO69448.1 NADH dehydrogenase I, subunit J [Stigmatella aurantiaca DW4/3-1]EAU66738.1 NADH-quinone oxidoreductase chain 10 [Stigmatella aurantiaca DW4/3-1]